MTKVEAEKILEPNDSKVNPLIPIAKAWLEGYKAGLKNKGE